MRPKTWIVQSVKNGFSYRPKEHTSLVDATTEASRLVTQNPKDTFLIYELVRDVEVRNISVIMIENASDVTSPNNDDDEDGYLYFNHEGVRG